MQVSNSLKSFLFQLGPTDRGATYSEDAQEFALEVLDLFEESSEDLTSASEVAQEVFEEIIESGSTTNAEKSLAALGASLSELKTKNPQHLALAQRSVLTSIAAAVPGPVGQVLAQAGIEAVEASQKSPTVAAQVGELALEAIIESPDTTYQEKSLAAFGLEFSESSSAKKTSHARQQFLEAIADGVNGAESDIANSESDLASSKKLTAHLTNRFSKS